MTYILLIYCSGLIFMKEKQSFQKTLFGEIITEEKNDDDNGDEFKEINVDDFEGEHKCPRCGFEWND